MLRIILILAAFIAIHLIEDALWFFVGKITPLNYPLIIGATNCNFYLELLDIVLLGLLFILALKHPKIKRFFLR